MVTRRLAAVLCADVAGFSRLAERDETRTHDRLSDILKAVVAAAIAAEGGRIVKTMGDGVLAEFESATSAVRSATAIQRAMAERNAPVPLDDRIVFRIGINLGEIIVDGDDIFGDGVNVASRLEGLAVPGAIAVSSQLWEQVREDVGVDATDAGEHHVKSIERTIHVLHLQPRAAGAAPRPPGGPSVRRQRLSPGQIATYAAAALVVAATAAWLAHDRLTPASATQVVRLRSLMVMPFSAAPQDPGLIPVAARLTEATTRTLRDSLRNFRLVNAAAAPAPAGATSDAKVLGRDAAVRFLVEGDLRPSESNVAITLRLIDTRDGEQVESRRTIVERDALRDPDAVAPRLAASARSMVVGAISRMVAAQGPRVENAEDLVDRAFSVSLPDPVATAREMGRLADEAIRLDPSLARAWAMRASSRRDLWFSDLSADVAPLLAEAEAASLRAVTLDPRDAWVWLVRGDVLHIQGNLNAAFAANDRAQELDPSRDAALVERAWYYLDAGRPDETLRLVARLRPVLGAHASVLALQACMAQLLLGAYDEAIAECERAGTDWDTWLRHASLAAAYAMRGDAVKAARERERLMKAVPVFTIGRYVARYHPPLAPEAIAMDKAHLVEGLRRAGAPE